MDNFDDIRWGVPLSAAEASIPELEWALDGFSPPTRRRYYELWQKRRPRDTASVGRLQRSALWSAPLVEARGRRER